MSSSSAPAASEAKSSANKRMSPFDELMAQHQQQLQRERQLLRIASGRGFMDPEGGTTIPMPPPPPASAPKIEDTLAEPPFEYSTPAMSDLAKKSLSETTADVKKGLLSSFLEKVRSKEEAAALAASNVEAKGKPPQRLVAPLASSESLSVSDAGSMKRMSATSSNVDSTATSNFLINDLVLVELENATGFAVDEFVLVLSDGSSCSLAKPRGLF